ncbi:flagellar export protein FliJ [Anaerobacillus sp. MEB173]|uniref:flagellar export protein FliJ n=1 Tax=Anaerobacillus sp. MEB173 TaxID=3383345 RepID=UPI003F8FE24E
MVFDYTLQKILDVKKREKNAVEGEYQEATKSFEEVATNLYNLLKKKEQLEFDYQGRLERGVMIGELQLSQSTIYLLENHINKVEVQTQQARNYMNSKKDELLEKSIELKKYEKMKELQYEQFVQHLKVEENKQMDEISTQQFINR